MGFSSIPQAFFCIFGLFTITFAFEPASIQEMVLDSRSTLTGAAYDEPTGMAIDSGKNIILSGTFRGSMDFDPGSGTHTETAPGSDEYGFIAKYSPEGALLWVHTYKSYLRGNTKYGDITVDTENNILVTGICKGSVDLGFGSSGGVIPSVSGWAAFVAKYQANGDFVWAVPILPATGTAYPQPHRIEVDATDAVLLSGTVSGSVDFDPTAGTSIIEATGGYSSGFVVKYNSSGSLEWAKGLPNAGLVIVTAGPENSVGIAGDFYDSTNVSGSPTIYSDSRFENPLNHGLFAGSLDSDGAYVWLEEFGARTSTIGNENVTDIEIDENGTTYITGRYNGEFRIDDFVLADTLRYQPFWAAFNEEGTTQMALSHSMDASPKRLTLNSEGDLYVAGNIHEDTLEGIINSHFFVSRYSENDTLLWLMTRDDDGTLDNLIDFALLDDNTALISGYVYDPDAPNRDPFFGKWTLPEPTPTTKLAETINTQENTAFLNLSSDHWLEVHGLNEQTLLTIRNLQGKTVFSTVLRITGTAQISLQNLNPGPFFVQLKTKSKTLNHKILVLP